MGGREGVRIEGAECQMGLRPRCVGGNVERVCEEKRSGGTAALM